MLRGFADQVCACRSLPLAQRFLSTAGRGSLLAAAAAPAAAAEQETVEAFLELEGEQCV